MTLSSLIRKHDTGGIATAIPAISATRKGEGGGTVARIATVAVANPKEGQAAPPAKVGTGDTATASHRQPSTPMTAEGGTAIRAWLVHIEETDPGIIAEVMDKCHANPGVLAYFLRRTDEVPPIQAITGPVTCATCGHYHRASHPHLGRCAAGEPEDPAGLWGTDQRVCDAWRPQ